MRSIKLIVLAVAVVMASVAIPAVAAQGVTVGQFVQEIAKAKNLNATDARIAMDSLRAVGIRLPQEMNLSKRLTEGDVVVISRAAGLPVNTTKPEAAFDQDQVDEFFSVFAIDLGVIPTDDPPVAQPRVPDFNPFSKGKGKHKGKSKWSHTPTEPE